MAGVNMAGGHRRKAVPATDPVCGEEEEDEQRILYWDPWLHPYGPALAKVSEVVFPLLPPPSITPGRKPRADAVERRKACLNALVANLAAFCFTTGVYAAVAVPLSNSKLTRYDCGGFSSELLSAAVHGLKQIGLIALVPAAARQTRTYIMPAGSFKALMERHGVTLADVGWMPGGETILLRTKRDGGKGVAIVDYQDTPETCAMRHDIEIINETINAADIRLDGNPTPPVHLVRMFQIEGEKAAHVFNRHGRIYRGFWQELPKGLRHLLTIEGEPVADLDVMSMFIQIAYAEQGMEVPPGDPYAIPGLEQYRSTVKQLTSSLFARTGHAMRVPRGLKEKLPTSWTMRRFVAAISEKHPALVPAFGNGSGLRFMHTESQILVAALLELAACGIAALPMHDGLMVAESRRPRAVAALADAGRKILGRELPVVEKPIMKPR